MPSAATRAWAAQKAELTRDLGQQMRSYSHDARHALLQHDLQQGHAAERRIRSAQELGVARRLRGDQTKLFYFPWEPGPAPLVQSPPSNFEHFGCCVCCVYVRWSALGASN